MISIPETPFAMTLRSQHFLTVLFSFGLIHVSAEDLTWPMDSDAHVEHSDDAVFDVKGVAPEAKVATVLTKIKSFDEKQSVSSLFVFQSPIWQNWNPIENLGPKNLRDAPVLLTMGPGDYWIFGRFGGGQPGQKKGETAKPLPQFTPEETTLDGFEVPLKTTRFPNVFDAPGGLKPSKGGYHAWQSRDMENWVHHGPVTEGFSRWVTSAEMVDGKAYIYYDFPNDQDPHVYVDSDLTDGEPGENMGLAVADPSHGSDAGFIRDLDGKMHVIIEDWSPINAKQRSWDSPLAGHAVSETGLGDFVFGKPAVDARTKATGETGTYEHPHWAKEDPENYSSGIAEYEIHEPEQEAYGDWAAISIGGQYYLFADFDPEHGTKMSTAWFTSSDIDEEFTFCDHIGEGHPDPDVAFANGQFYLATQQQTDWTSPGPWVGTVEVRVGVDTNQDGSADTWSEWQEVSESYDYIEGFAKQVKKSPATMDLSDLPEGYGFQVEMKLTDSTENKSKPIIESIRLVVE